MHTRVQRVQLTVSAVLSCIVRCVCSKPQIWSLCALLGNFAADSITMNGCIWYKLVNMTCGIECIVLKSTFVLHGQLYVAIVEAPMLPGAGSSAQLYPGILPASSKEIDHNRSSSTMAVKLPGYFNAVAPARAALHGQS